MVALNRLPVSGIIATYSDVVVVGDSRSGRACRRQVVTLVTAKRAFNEALNRFTRQLHLYGGLLGTVNLVRSSQRSVSTPTVSARSGGASPDRRVTCASLLTNIVGRL